MADGGRSIAENCTYRERLNCVDEFTDLTKETVCSMQLRRRKSWQRTKLKRLRCRTRWLQWRRRMQRALWRKPCQLWRRPASPCRASTSLMSLRSGQSHEADSVPLFGIIIAPFKVKQNFGKKYIFNLLPNELCSAYPHYLISFQINYAVHIHTISMRLKGPDSKIEHNRWSCFHAICMTMESRGPWCISVGQLLKWHWYSDPHTGTLGVIT